MMPRVDQDRGGGISFTPAPVAPEGGYGQRDERGSPSDISEDDVMGAGSEAEGRLEFVSHRDAVAESPASGDWRSGTSP